MEKATRGVAPDLSFGPLTQAEPLDAARVEFADAAKQSRRLQFRPQAKQSAGKQRNRADRQRVFGAAINREAARRGRRPALKLYSQLAQNPDRRAAGVERMRAEVEMETLLLVRPCPPASPPPTTATFDLITFSFIFLSPPEVDRIYEICRIDFLPPHPVNLVNPV